MKKTICLFLTTLFIALSFAQNPNYQQKLFYTCKVWGFVKYYHSEVSQCKVNWDSVLTYSLPKIKNCTTKNDFNNILDTMLIAAGPMALAASALPDTLSPDLKRNRNFSWFNDTIIRADIKTKLDTIKNNFRPHPICWVKNNTNPAFISYLAFPHDSLLSNINTSTSFPGEYEMLAIVFKYWNIINYFNPYNYILDTPWDSTLNNNIISIANAPNRIEFFKCFKKIAANLNDAHAEGLTISNMRLTDYYYGPPLVLKYMESKYVVVKSGVTGISKGDIILSTNNLTTTQWEDSLRPYVSAGNSSVFRRVMCQQILCGLYNSSINISYKDSSGTTRTTSVNRTTNYYTYSSGYYPTDSLGNTKWKKLDCNIGYINIGKLLSADVTTMYAALKNCSALIFDMRNYPASGALRDIANLMLSNSTCFSKLMQPDVEYPGTFYWNKYYTGINGNPTPYQGKVFALFNEVSQSASEYYTMILDAHPNCIKVGSQTAGADGTITKFYLTQDIQAGYTNLGVYYPNNDSTQRIGIIPDSLVQLTQKGIQQGKDEVLEKAIQIAGCTMASSNNPEKSEPLVLVYPNPNNGNMYLQCKVDYDGESTFEIVNLEGRTVIQKKFHDESETITINEANLSDGIYFYKLFNDNTIIKTGKIVITR